MITPALLDALPAVLFVADPLSGELLYVNAFAGERFGTPWQGRTYRDYLPQGEAQPCACCTGQTATREGKQGAVGGREFRNPRDGRWYHCLTREVQGDDGRTVWLGIAFDITSRREADARREALLGEISHEMRTPLTSILGFSELLLDEPSLPAPARRQIETIASEAGKLRTLIEYPQKLRRAATHPAP